LIRAVTDDTSQGKLKRWKPIMVLSKAIEYGRRILRPYLETSELYLLAWRPRGAAGGHAVIVAMSQSDWTGPVPTILLMTG